MSTRLPSSTDATVPNHRPPSPATGPIPPEVKAARPSAHFGKFVRVERIGTGAMGEVWRAWDTEIERWVALKFLKSHDDEEEARFEREARMAAGLTHSNIASIYETGMSHGQRFIAMQYVRGFTLENLPKLSRRDLVAILRDAALAVHIAHEKGIVHRDIKPGNLIVSKKPDGELHVYVLDFGLARPAAGSDISASGMVLGTPVFMPPEQARGGRIDARADVYAFGATLWSLLTRRLPFEGGGVYDLLRRIQREEPMRPRDIDPSIDPDLESIVLKAMEKDRDRRYPTALAFAEDLTRWLRNETIDARPSTFGYRLRKWESNHRSLLVTAAVSGLAIVVVLGLIVPRWLSERRAATHVSNEAAGVEKHRAAMQELDRIWSRVATTREWTRQSFRRPEDIRFELEKSVADLNGFVESHADMMQGWYVRGRARLALGNLAGARQDLHRATALAPGFALGWFYLALTSLEEFQEALPGASEDAEAVRRRMAHLLEESVGFLNRVGDGASRPSKSWGLSISTEDEIAANVAEALLDRYVRNDPEAGLRRLESAYQARKSEDYCLWLGRWSPETRLEWSDRGIAIAPHGLGCILDRGLARLSARDLEGAAADFRKSIVINPNRALPVIALAHIHYLKGEVEAAEEGFTEAIRLDPVSAVAHINRGLIRQNANRLDEALQDYTKALELDPRMSSAWANRGSVLQSLGRLDQALADFAAAIERNPNCTEAYSNRATVRIDKGDLDRALDDANQAIRIRPDHVQAWSNRGNIHSYKGRLDLALADHTRAVEMRPEMAQVWINRAIVLQNMKNSDAAMADLDRAVRAEPGYAEAYLNRGTVHGMRRELAEMMADYDKAIELDPTNPLAFFNRGKGHQMTRNLEKSIQDYTAAIRLKPDYYNAFANRGEARQYSNDRSGARSDYEQALRFAPENWPLREKVRALAAQVTD